MTRSARLRPALLATVALATLLLPGAALAQSPEWSTDQWIMLELKLGPYAPNIDAEFDGSATPFKDLFQSPTGLFLAGELDVEVWRPFGTLAVGLGLGWYGKSAKALVDTGDDTTPASDLLDRSEGDTTINVLPVSVLAIYRADFLWEEWGVPLIPFVKFGVNYSFWWITKGNGDVAKFGDETARGGTWGWQFNAGLSLLLDVFEPAAAKNMDVETGINHTYLFFEFYHLSADGFGASDALRVGDTSYVGGLALEF